MSTATEFIKSGVTGQTFREITEKFGKNFNAVAAEDQVMANFALAFAWFREREHVNVPEAFDKAMSLTTAEVEALFDTPKKKGVKAEADFASQPPTTTP